MRFMKGEGRGRMEASLGGIVLAAGMFTAILYHAGLEGAAPGGRKGDNEVLVGPGEAPPLRPEYRAPHPTMSPEEVVSIVLEAMDSRKQPSPEAGWDTFGRFMTPEARAVWHKKSERGRPAPASCLLWHADHAAGPVEVSGDRARQDVVAQHILHGFHGFEFELCLRKDGPQAGCWLIDNLVPRDDLRKPALEHGNSSANPLRSSTDNVP